MMGMRLAHAEQQAPSGAGATPNKAHLAWPSKHVHTCRTGMHESLLISHGSVPAGAVMQLVC